MINGTVIQLESFLIPSTHIYTQVGRSEPNLSNGAEETWHTHLAQFLRDVGVDN